MHILLIRSRPVAEKEEAHNIYVERRRHICLGLERPS